MASETVDINFRANIKDLTTQLGKLDGITAGEAKKMVIALEKQMKAAEAASKKAAKGSAGGWKDSLAKIGKSAGFGDLIEKFGAMGSGAEGLAASAGVASGAIAGIAVAGVAAAVGVYKLTRAGRDALDALDAIGQGDLVTDAQRDQVEEANAALDAMGIAAQALTVSIASQLGPAVTDLATDLASFELFLKKVIDGFDTGALSIESFGDILKVGALQPLRLAIDALDGLNGILGVSNPGIHAMAQMIDGWSDSLASNAFATHADTEEQKALLAVTTDAKPIVAAVVKLRKDNSAAAKAEAAAIKEATAAYKDEISALKELGMIGQKAAEDTLDPLAKLAVAYEEQMVLIDQTKWKAIEAGEKAGNAEDAIAEATASATAAMADVTSRYYRDRNDAIQQMAASAEAAEAAMMAADAAATEAFEKNQDTQAEAGAEKWQKIEAAVGPYLDALGSIVDSMGDLADLLQTLHQDKLDADLDELASLRKKYKGSHKLMTAEDKARKDFLVADRDRQKKAIKTAFAAKKAAGITGALIDGAEAVIKAFSMFGPPPSPPGIAAAAAAGIATGVSVATIAAQKPPTFHIGSTKPEGLANVAAGEGIVSRTGMAKPGAKQTVDALNGAPGSQGQGGQIIVPLYLNGRHIDTLVASAIKTGAETRKALRFELKR